MKKQNKTRLTLKLNPNLIHGLKTEAAASKKSVSELSEEYLERCLPKIITLKISSVPVFHTATRRGK